MKCRALSSKSVRVNDFQIIDKGNELFLEATGQGYSTWLTDDEVNTMNIMFQRRHVLEHNGGMVDIKYLEKSNDSTYNAGQRLVIHRKDAVELIEIVRKLGQGIKGLQNNTKDD